MRNVMARKRQKIVAVLAVLVSAVAWCATPYQSRVIVDQTSLTRLEEPLHRMPVHLSEFSPVSAPLAVPRCGDVRPPEALATPDPLLQVDNADLRVRVSFIVGADGRVHSAFVLDSGGPREDQIVLRTIHRWRYRPALCNGVPTDSETRVQFGIR
jgi:TonB family protein